MATSAIDAVTQSRFKVTPVIAVTLGAFVLCFGLGIVDLVQAWINIPDSAHGLLIAPVAIWLAWRRGIVDNPHPRMWTGSAILAVAIALYILGRTGGVETVPRVAFFLALVGLTLWYGGWRQLFAWWLPFVLFGLTIPLPESIIASITLPLQGIAAEMGATLLSWRNIPVMLSGNIIRLPGHMLFVSEACSGLRSLTALVSMAILVGALFLKHPITRVLMLATSVGLAIVVNGIRVFLTGFLVYFIDPKLGEGFMHLSEGYLLFLVSLGILSGITWLYMRVERLVFYRTPKAIG
jgi:exosortase